MVRVALLLPGRLIGYSHGYLLRRFVNEAPRDIAVDIFVCTWSKAGPESDQDLDEARLVDMFRPTLYRVVDIRRTVPDPTRRNGRIGPLTSVGENQFFMLKECYQLMEEYCRESGKYYDYVIRGRLDISIDQFPWARLLPFVDRDQRVPNFRRLSRNILYFAGGPEDDNCVWISDQFAVASSEVMKVYCGLFDTYPTFYDDEQMKLIAAMCKPRQNEPNPRGFWFGLQNHMFLTCHLFRNQVATSGLQGCKVTIHRKECSPPDDVRHAAKTSQGPRPQELLDAFSVRPPRLWVYTPDSGEERHGKGTRSIWNRIVSVAKLVFGLTTFV